MSIKTKAMTGTKLIKSDDAAGTATVAFAQLKVIDHDADYTINGAFQQGQKVKVCQTGHAHGALPCGAGAIVGEMDLEGATWAVADLKFFLDTPQGDATYKTVKALAEAGHTQEWSYGYDILDAEQNIVDGKSVQVLKSLSVYEISPVLRGAGIGTHTLAVKTKDGECETCGQALPKAAAICETCDNPLDDCTCKKTTPLDAEDGELVAKVRPVDALASFELTRARLLGVSLE